MGVYRRGKIWYIDCYQSNGARIRKKVGNSKKQAERVLEKVKTQVIEDKYFDIEKSKKIKLKDFAEKFISTYCKANKNSWKSDVVHLKQISSYLGDVYLNEITALKIEEFKRHRLEQGIKPATVNRALACLKTMFNKALEWQFLTKNPISNIKLLKEDNKRLRFLEKEEIERLLCECSPHVKNVVYFALNTGMRRGEILNLKWSDVDFSNKLIFVNRTKTKEKRTIPINTQVERMLVKTRELYISEYVFCNEDGGRLKSIRTSFRNALKRAGISDFRFHDLRHTYASHLAMSNVDLFTIKELLGHKRIEMTSRYSHISQSHKAKAVELLGQKLDTIQTQTQESTDMEKLSFMEVIGR